MDDYKGYMAKKDIQKDQLRIEKIFKLGPKTPKIGHKDWDFLVYELKKLKVSPGEAYRIVAEKKDRLPMLDLNGRCLDLQCLFGRE